MNKNGKKSAPVPEGELVRTFVRNEREELRLTIDDYKGRKFLNLRIWAKLEGEWWPTKKGVMIRPEDAEELAEAIRSAMECIETT